MRGERGERDLSRDIDKMQEYIAPVNLPTDCASMPVNEPTTKA